jgi:glycosyltransferase involved in cell wall biosynthesis
MSATPLISVCMPVHDGARFLDAAIASIRAQSFADLELVIVDDESSDESPAIIARHAAADARIVARRIAHGGVAVACNATLETARGRYVARMDADDVALPERLALTLAYLETHHDVAVVGGAAEVIDADDRVETVVRPPEDPDLLARVLPTTNAIINSTTLARRDVLRELGGYRRAFEGAEDGDLWLRVLDRHRLANIGDIVLRYRRHMGHASYRTAETQAIASIAARAAARLRRAGRPDPVGDAPTLTPELLERLGLTPGVLHAEIFRRLLLAARGAAAAGNADYAAGLLDRLRAIASPAEYLPIAAEFGARGVRVLTPAPSDERQDR